MIDLTSKALPSTIMVGGRAFSIVTDYRVWMRFCQEYELWDKKGSIDIEYLFNGEIPMFMSVSDYNGIFEFAYPRNVVPRYESSGERIIDYVIDSDYIYSAFYEQYGIDLLKVDMHWHVFKALLNSISGSTKLGEIMGYRSYTGEKINSQDEMYRKLKNAWELPRIESDEEKELDREFEEYFG